MNTETTKAVDAVSKLLQLASTAVGYGNTPESGDAQRYTQAALNAAHVAQMLQNIELLDQEKS